VKQQQPQSAKLFPGPAWRRRTILLALLCGCATWFCSPSVVHAYRGLPLSVLALPLIPGPAEHPGLEQLETKFIQVHPALVDPTKPVKSKNHNRAVVLIHGYWIQLHKEKVAKAKFKDWQMAGSPLVSTLAIESDVFAFAYGQSVGVEEIAQQPGLAAAVAQLKKLGYKDIVLVGHSAGGLVARYFVEDFPKSGVTKVVQVCSPNGGCTYAEIKWTPKNQRPFLNSLTRAGREQCLRERASKKIPSGVQFVCVVTAEDALVPCRCQWTEDLQDQGVPVVRFAIGHRLSVRKASEVKKIAQVVAGDYPRWDAEQVGAARKLLYKTKKLHLPSSLPSLRPATHGSTP
jgi:pimeloyl-ACP methyl ester carboxylesterase